MQKFREIDNYETPTLMSASLDPSSLCNCDYENDLVIKCDAEYKDQDEFHDVTNVTLTMSLYLINDDIVDALSMTDDELISEITINQNIYWKANTTNFDIDPEDIKKYLWNAIEMGKMMITQSCIFGNIPPIVLNITEEDIIIKEMEDNG